jgi:hypothetical protein
MARIGRALRIDSNKKTFFIGRSSPPPISKGKGARAATMPERLVIDRQQDRAGGAHPELGLLAVHTFLQVFVVPVQCR